MRRFSLDGSAVDERDDFLSLRDSFTRVDRNGMYLESLS